MDVYYIDLHMAVKRFLKKIVNNLKCFINIILNSSLLIVFIRFFINRLIVIGYCLVAKIYDIVMPL